MRQASAAAPAARSSDDRRPVSSQASVSDSESVTNRMNSGSDHANPAAPATGTENAIARRRHAARNLDARRRRIQRPATRIVSPNAAALSGPAASSGSKTPKPAIASAAGNSGAQ